jgi:hypothetical protein
MANGNSKKETEVTTREVGQVHRFTFNDGSYYEFDLPIENDRSYDSEISARYSQAGMPSDVGYYLCGSFFCMIPHKVTQQYTNTGLKEKLDKLKGYVPVAGEVNKLVICVARISDDQLFDGLCGGIYVPLIAYKFKDMPTPVPYLDLDQLTGKLVFDHNIVNRYPSVARKLV